MISEVEYAPGQKGDLHIPDISAPAEGFPCVLLIHGGAWCSMERSAMDGIALMLCQEGFAVFNIDYRLAPEHRWPGGLDDCKEALKYLSNTGENSLPLNTGRIFVMGASSGGHYALITGFSAPRGSVAGIISLSGIDEVFTDERLFPGRYRTLLGYAPGTEDLNTLDPAGFYQEGAAPVLCTHFVRDTVVPLDSCLTFAQKLRELGAHPSLYLYDFGRDNQGHALWIPETKPRRLYADLEQTVLFFLKNTLSQDDAQRGKHEN